MTIFSDSDLSVVSPSPMTANARAIDMKISVESHKSCCQLKGLLGSLSNHDDYSNKNTTNLHI